MKYSGLLIFLGLIIGLVAGRFIGGTTVPTLMNWYITLGLILLLYISALEISLRDVVVSFKKPWHIIFLSLMKMIGLPLIAFIFLKYVPENFRVAVMLLSATPAAMATPGLLLIIKGNVKLGMIVSVVTNLIAPLTMPVILLYSLGVTVKLDVVHMFFFLAIIVFLPFLLSFLSKRFLPKFANFVSKNSSGIIIVHLFLFNICVIAPYSNLIFSNLNNSYYLLFVAFLLSAIFHVLGILFAFWKKDKVYLATGIIIFAYFNTGFSIVLSSQYFDQTTTLVAVFYEIFWALGLIPLQFIFNPQSGKKHSLKTSPVEVLD